MTYFQKKSVASEFLRNILNYFWKETEAVICCEDKTLPNLVGKTPVIDEKEEAILYYVVGATVHSVCGIKKRNGAREASILQALAVTGVSSKDIEPYIGVVIPDVVSWIVKQNRGGLTFVKIKCFTLFKIIDKEVKKFYNKEKPLTNQKENANRKDLVFKAISCKTEIYNLWLEILNEDIGATKDEIFRQRVFHKLIESFLKLRGKGLKLYLTGKHFGGKTQKSQPSLRRGLKRKMEKSK